MFTRHKHGRGGPFLQVVESYRMGGHKRQRVVLYVGPYADVEQALVQLAQDSRGP